MPASPRERWLRAVWEIVEPHLPQPRSSIVELGCGPLGGLVPRLRAAGHVATGIDPQAPDEPFYQRIEFEHARLPEHVDVVVACLALHHVGDPASVIERIAGALGDGGSVVVVEWDWEAFDERTARWSFARLPAEPESWLHRRREEWIASQQPWAAYLETWALQHGLHRAQELLDLLDRRFERRVRAPGPYLFPELVDTDEADEQAAIERAEIRPTRVDYVGVRGTEEEGLGG